jgi:hypothetical protein
MKMVGGLMPKLKEAKLRFARHWVTWSEKTSPTIVTQETPMILQGYEYAKELKETELVAKYEQQFPKLLGIKDDETKTNQT